MKKIMFTVRMGNPLEDDFMVSLDTFFPMELTEEEWELSTNMRALAELSVVPYNIDQVCKANSNYIKATEFRLRFNQDMYQHICMVTLPDGADLDRDSLDFLINSKSKEELKTFLKDARFFR